MSTKISHNSQLLLEPAFVILECQWESSGRDWWGSDIHTPLILGYYDLWSHWVKRSYCLIFSLRASRGISLITRQLRTDGKSYDHHYFCIFRVVAHGFRLTFPSMFKLSSLQGALISMSISTLAASISQRYKYCDWTQRNSKPVTSVFYTRVI